MKLTALSFIMSAVWSSIIILVVHLVRRKQFFLNGFGIGTIILLYLFSFGRMFLAIEFPFTYEIPVPEVYNVFFRSIYFDHIGLSNHQCSLVDVFVAVWCIVSIVLILVFLTRYASALKRYKAYLCEENDKLTAILNETQSKYGTRLNVRIFTCRGVTMPIGVGFLDKRILIPAADYSDDELSYIILHEYMHFCNKDLLILFLTELFARIFWWNLFVYLLRNDIRQILEIKCDLSVTTGMCAKQRADYLKAIHACLIQAGNLKVRYLPPVSTQLIRRDNKKTEMLERFRLIAYPVKKNYSFYQILSIVCFVLLIVVSYLFILQPQYQPPEEDVFTDTNVGVSGTLSGYILAKKDGTYVFIDETGFEMIMKKETVEIFASGGFEIREE